MNKQQITVGGTITKPETDPLAIKLSDLIQTVQNDSNKVASSAAVFADLAGKATPAQITTAINDLINAAPSALNTLNELAIALGNDANFATTVIGLLAGKASSSHTHSQSDITNLISDLAGKASSSHSHAMSDITGLISALADKATPSDITTAINSLINSAPGALDTLAELATALGNDASFASTITTALAGKAPQSTTYTKTEVDSAIAGAGSSLPSFTAGESITTGDLVELRSDAKIYKAVAETLGSWVTAGGMNSDNFKYAMKTGTDEFMAFGCGGSVDYYAIGGTIASNGVITLGSALTVSFTNRSFTGVNLIWHPIHNKFFAFCTDSSANYMVTPLSLASNVTTKGTSQSIIASASVSYINVHYSVANQRVIFVYTDPLNTSYLSCCSYTINADGTSVAGTKLVISSANYGGDFTSIWDDTYSSLLVFYSSGTSANQFAYFTWSAGVFTSKGSQSFSYLVRDYNGAVLTLAPVLFKYDNNRNYFLVLTNSFNVYTRLIAISYDVTMDNIAIGGIEFLDIWRQNNFNWDVVSHPMVYDQTTNMLYGISWQNATFTDCILYGYKLSYNGKAVRMLRRVIYPYTSGSTSGYALSLGTNGKILIGAIYGSSIVARCYINNTLNTKFLGVSQETKTVNNSCKVAVAGTISTVHSALTIGADYFVSEANVVSTSMSEKPLGYSLSATNLLIKRNAY